VKLSGEQLAILARFSKSPDCAALLQILRAELAEADAHLRTASGEDIFRAQGRAQELDRLITRFVTAQDQLNRSVQRPVRQAAFPPQ